jgi:hypothetical protein
MESSDVTLNCEARWVSSTTVSSPDPIVLTKACAFFIDYYSKLSFKQPGVHHRLNKSVRFLQVLYGSQLLGGGGACHTHRTRQKLLWCVYNCSKFGP